MSAEVVGWCGVGDIAGDEGEVVAEEGEVEGEVTEVFGVGYGSPAWGC